MLPAPTTQSARLNRSEQQIQPGSWWRLTDPAHSIMKNPWQAGAGMPDHGLVLLVEEVRVIDGDLHTIVLHAHPGWSSQDGVKVLAADFLAAFAHEPEGEALRAAEMALLMDRISEMGKAVSNIPADHLLLQDAKTETNEQAASPAPAAGAGTVPAVLLPGGDVTAAQMRLEQEISIMRLRQNWIEARQSEMKDGWKLVTGYQTERAAASMAAISARTAQVSSMLDKVHSMSLWLGEGVTTEVLVEGVSADADQPLHLMQRMLYLDEEIHTHSMLETGFTADNMSDLGSLLEQNPALVERMLPHPRSVVITRVRRNSREMPFPKSWEEIFAQINKQEADQLIQILIRDGGRVLMITADAETSKAERLFPSRAEIDEIFTQNDGYDWNSHAYKMRSITPHDIEYSDKRSEHDKRALFYRRFLLILWGAQEREQVFGPFIPAGSNWLEATVHNEYFRFVHDEEDVLDDGRPDVLSWIAARNARMAPGSQVLVQGMRAMNTESAPTCFKLAHPNPHPYRQYVPVEDFTLVKAQRSGASLMARIPCLKAYSDDAEHVQKPLLLRGPDNQSPEEGVLCLDEVTVADLRYYIASRVNRESYLKWLGLFQAALPIVEALEAAQRALADAAIETRLVKEADRGLAMLAARAQLQAMRSPAITEAAALKTARMVERLRAGPPKGMPESEVITLDHLGTWRAICQDERILDSGLPVPLLRQVNCGKSGKAVARKEQLTSYSMSLPLGQVIVQDNRKPDRIEEIWEHSAPGLRAPKDWMTVEKLLDGEQDWLIEKFFKTWSRPGSYDLERIFHQSAEISLEPKRQYDPAVILRPQVVLGAAMAPTASFGHANDFAGFVIVANADPCAAAVRSHGEAHLERYAHSVFVNGAAKYEDLLTKARKAKTLFTLSAVPVTDTMPLSAHMTGDATERPHPVLRPRSVEITGWKSGDRKSLELTTFEELLTWHDIRSGVSKELGERLTEATPRARRFIAPAAEAFLEASGF
ncbi:hypothetical protein AB9K35_16640 [Leisingera sp. XS_AS12]|uniref:hypothetical protein n=1 Tax=Leisingera sp. XS_AS12 TaxID=3241294 RepID=UPI003515D1C4